MELDEIIIKTLKIDPSEVEKDYKKEDVDGWDSLAHLELIAAIEEHLSIELTLDQMVSLTSFQQIRALKKISEDLKNEKNDH